MKMQVYIINGFTMFSLIKSCTDHYCRVQMVLSYGTVHLQHRHFWRYVSVTETFHE